MKSVTSRSVYKITEMMSSSSSIWFMSSKEDSCLRKYFYTNDNSQQVGAFKISWYVTRDSESEISMQEGTRRCFRYKLSLIKYFCWILYELLIAERSHHSWKKRGTKFKLYTVGAPSFYAYHFLLCSFPCCTCLGVTTGAKWGWKVLRRSVIGFPCLIGGNSSSTR